jgi:hypothetical protein
MPINPVPEARHSPPDTRDSMAVEEYRALRNTIRERGSLRHLTTTITFSVWAATMLWVAGSFTGPAAFVVPLVMLAAGFEVGFALHVGVERVGRFLQVRYERTPGSFVSWEKTAMPLRVPSGGVDPLFLKLYLGGAIINLAAAIWPWLLTGIRPEKPAGALVFAIIGVTHIAAILRWQLAARFAASQRARELSAIEELVR